MFKCEICGREFETMWGLSVHIGRLHKSETIKEFKCEICGKEFEKLRGLLCHIGWKHKDETIKEFKCEICGKEFEKLRGLLCHISWNHKKEIIKEFKCEICDKEFKTLIGLQIHNGMFHKKINVKEIIKEFKCEICGKEFETLKGFGIHNGKSHKNEIIKEFKCDICGKEFKTLMGLQVHNSMSHKKINVKEIIKKVKCELCGREFENLRGLIAHFGQSHKNEITIEEYYLKFIGEKGKCVECGKNTNFINLMEGYHKFCSLKCSANSIEVKNKKKETRAKKSKHKYSSQNSEFQKEIKLNVECKICGKKFETSKGLTTHIGHIHKNEMTREEYYLKFIGEKGKCPECGKDTNFMSLMEGYHKFCSAKCSSSSIEIQNKMKETNFKKTGYTNSMYNPKNKEKYKQTCLENSGYGNPSQNPETKKKKKETILKNYNGIHPCKLTFTKLQEKYPDLVKIEELKEGPNGEILAHCKNSNCKNSKENGGYFEPTIYQIGHRNYGINANDTYNLYCCEECKHTCLLYGKSATELHNIINENKDIPYTPTEYNTWKEEVYYRQRIENNIDTNFCEYCHTTENLQVHHEIPQKIEPGYALDPINGIIACKDCHYEKGHKKGTECSTGNLASKICK